MEFCIGLAFEGYITFKSMKSHTYILTTKHVQMNIRLPYIIVNLIWKELP
jgi:hypothetical protein